MVSGVTVITSSRLVLPGFLPSARTRATASRPVKMPASPPLSLVTKTAPTLRARILRAASKTLALEGRVKGFWWRTRSDIFLMAGLFVCIRFGRPKAGSDRPRAVGQSHEPALFALTEFAQRTPRAASAAIVVTCFATSLPQRKRGRKRGAHGNIGCRFAHRDDLG